MEYLNGQFKNFIDDAIINFPTLYLKNTYDESVFSVLNHIFFVIGNGFFWKNGYPFAIEKVFCNEYGEWYNKRNILKSYKTKDINLIFDEEIFFIDTDDKPDCMCMIRNNLSLRKELHNSRIGISTKHGFFFKGLELRNKINYYIDEYNKTHEHICKILCFRKYKLSPYEISNHSAIMEMVNGKDYCGKLVELNNNQETLFYAKIIVDYALDFYTDQKKYVYHNFYSDDYILLHLNKKSVEELKVNDCWEEFRLKQLEQLNKIKKFLNT